MTDSQRDRWMGEHLQSGIRVGIMVGQIADVLSVFEGDGEGQSIKGCFPSVSNWTKVISGGEYRGSKK